MFAEMTDKLLKELLRLALHQRLRWGRLRLTLWDGTAERFGTSGDLLHAAVTDREVVQRMLTNASVAVGEAYMFDQLRIAEEDLPLFFEMVNRNTPKPSLQTRLVRREPNHERLQRRQIGVHYDLGNDYYDLVLGETGLYSCAYFEAEGDDLDTAQRQKIAHLIRKLEVQPRNSVLDIGCGWGYLAVEIAKQHPGVEVLGITLSKEQLKGARERAKREGVADRVSFELKGYQQLDGQFNRIISVGMFEHVGRKNHDDYFSQVARLLAERGVTVLHTITQEEPWRPVSPWVAKWIFPGGDLPTIAQVEKGLGRHGLHSIDRENLWEHYWFTLAEWYRRHKEHREEIIALLEGRVPGLAGEQAFRMRSFWYEGSMAGFAEHGRLGLNQWIATKGKPRRGAWPRTRRYLYRSTETA